MPSHELGIKKSLEPWNSALRKSSPAAQPCDNAIPEQIVFAQDIADRQKHLCFAFPIYPGLHSKTVSCTATALSTCERAANPLMLIRLSQQTGYRVWRPTDRFLNLSRHSQFTKRSHSSHHTLIRNWSNHSPGGFVLLCHQGFPSP